MKSLPPKEVILYKLIIQTNQYAGNFERELCAYLTGQIGDCEVGLEVAESFEEVCPEDICAEIQDITTSEVDDRGTYRPVGICFDLEESSGGNSALEIYFESLPSVETWEYIKSRIKKLAEEETNPLYRRAGYGKDTIPKILKVYWAKVVTTQETFYSDIEDSDYPSLYSEFVGEEPALTAALS